MKYICKCINDYRTNVEAFFIMIDEKFKIRDLFPKSPFIYGITFMRKCNCYHRTKVEKYLKIKLIFNFLKLISRK